MVWREWDHAWGRVFRMQAGRIKRPKRIRPDRASELELHIPRTHPTPLPTMPPRLNLLAAPRSLALRPRAAPRQWHATRIAAAPSTVRRCYADDASKKDLPESQDQKGPNTETLPHVTEEARDMAKMRKMPPPEVEQGTPVDEVRETQRLRRPSLR